MATHVVIRPSPAHVTAVVVPVSILVTFEGFGRGLGGLDAGRCRLLCHEATNAFAQAGAHVAFHAAPRIATFVETEMWGFVIDGSRPTGDLARYDPTKLDEVNRHPPPARGVRIVVCGSFREPQGGASAVHGLAIGCDPTYTDHWPGLARTILYPMDTVWGGLTARSFPHELGHLLMGPYHHRGLRPETNPPSQPFYNLMNEDEYHAQPWLNASQLAFVARNAPILARGHASSDYATSAPEGSD